MSSSEESTKAGIPPAEDDTTPTDEGSEEADLPNPPEESQRDQKVNDLLDRLDSKAQALDKTLESIGGFFKGFEKTIGKINQRLDNIEDKLPKEISKPKPSVKGYYDWDAKANTFINQAAKTDYERAKETIDIIKGLMQ